MPFANMVCSTLNKYQDDIEGTKRVKKSIKIILIIGFILVLTLILLP